MQLIPIGYIQSCFKEKFSTPRQPGLVRSSSAEIIIETDYSDMQAFTELREMNFIWIIFEFHLNKERESWKPQVRPPKLGGNKKVGVFATRAPYRPNPIGLSLVKLEDIKMQEQKIHLYISGHDLVEGTPVLDIKPYHPVADIPWEDARGGWIDELNIPKLKVNFSPEINQEQLPVDLKELIIHTLEHDPRPGYQDDDERVYGNRIESVNINWVVTGDTIKIIKITEV